MSKLGIDDLDIWVVTPEDSDEGHYQVGAGEIVIWAGKKLLKLSEAALENIAQAVPTIGYTLLEQINKKEGKKPEQIEIEFGISFKGEGKALVLDLGTNANFKVKMIWKP